MYVYSRLNATALINPVWNWTIYFVLKFMLLRTLLQTQLRYA